MVFRLGSALPLTPTAQSCFRHQPIRLGKNVVLVVLVNVNNIYFRQGNLLAYFEFFIKFKSISMYYSMPESSSINPELLMVFGSYFPFPRTNYSEIKGGLNLITVQNFTITI